MAVVIAVLIILAATLIGGGIAWSRYRLRRLAPGEPASRLPFRWRYILLPLILFIASVIVTVFFYAQLPWMAAYHFDTAGAPDAWAFREFIAAVGTGIQLILLLAAFIIVLTVSRLGFITAQSAPALSPQRLAVFMGNLLAVPQLIVLFALLDIFIFNAYTRHLFSMWLFLIIVLVLATLALFVFMFVFALRAMRQMKQ